MDKREVQYLKKVFATFGYRDANIVKVREPNELIHSFAVCARGEFIDSPDCESFFSVGNYPHFCILSKKGDVFRLDFCMELTFVFDYVVGLYLEDDFDDLGVYFIDDENEVPYCVEFGAIIDGVFVENFGTINSGEIFDRTITREKSNLPFREILGANHLKRSVFIDEPHLNNIMDLRLVNGDFETYADAHRFATSIDQLNDFMFALRDTNYTFKVIINTHIVSIDEAEDAEEEFEHSKNYWRGIYEVGLEE